MTDLTKQTRDIVSELARTRVFSHLKREKLETLVSLGRPFQFEKGTTILEEGLANNDIYFLLKGSVSVYSGGKLVAKYGRSGDIFGEMSVVSDLPISATVIANEDVETIVIDGNIVGSFRSDTDNELVTVFYKLFSLSLLEKLRLTTLKARLFEDAIRHVPMHGVEAPEDFSDRTVEQNLNSTLVTSLAVHTADHAIVILDTKGRLLRFNLAAESLFACIEVQVIGEPIEVLCREDASALIYFRLMNGEISSWTGELEFVKYTGETFPARVSASVIRGPDSENIGVLSIITDLSKQKRLEQELHQSRKMEAIGQLAGGVAHDFNNLLQIVVGNTEIALDRIAGDETSQDLLSRVLDAAERGSHITQRLLAFSRHQPLSKKIVDVNTAVNNLVGLLERMIEAHIEIKVQNADDAWHIYADPTLLEQVLMNLCLNARDAMPAGGMLTLETRNEILDKEFCKANAWAKPGEYVVISAADSGEGIEPKDSERIFEPFFTTKEPGKGTGLGLSMALGIVQEHDGLLNVESEVGAGTTVSIYLPRADDTSAAVEQNIRRGVAGGSERILVAEDERGVRDLVLRLLTNAGYTAFEASDGVEAIKIFEQEEIDLVLLDAIMPRMSGKEVYESLKAKQPALPIIFTSGHSREVIDAKFIESHHIPIIQKPYPPERLLRMVRDALDVAPPDTA